MKELIKNKFKEFGFDLTDSQIDKFEIYLNFLIEENEKFNLTAITDKEEIIVKHFIDSVLPIKEFALNAKVIDIGTGAGFPGVPLKILRNDLDIVLIDSLQKRINFLQNLTKMLNLDNIKCFHARAEDFAKENRECFNYAVSRAVAQMSTLSEYMLPFVKEGGYAVMYKGQKGDEELKESLNAIKILGGKNEKVLNFNFTHGERNIFFVKKTNKTPLKYPRDKNLPKLKPIK